MTSVTISAIAVVVSIVLLFYLVLRGVPLVISGFLCAALVALFSLSGFSNCITGNFITGLNTMMKNMFLPFMSGGLLGAMMHKSGCGESIANTLIKKLGVKSAPWIVMIFTSVIVASGMSLFMLIVAPVALSLMKRANLPKYVGLTAMAGSAPIVMCCVPYVPHANNRLPTMFLGTNLGAGALVGVIMTVVGYICVIFYVHYLVKKARNNNSGYELAPGETLDIEEKKTDLPNFWLSVLPIVLAVVLSIVFNKVAGLAALSAVFWSQFISAILVMVLYFKRITREQKLTKIVMDGLTPCIITVVSAGCITGFATVVQDTSAYAALVEGILNMNMNGYVLTVLAVALLCGASADSVGGILVYLQSLGGTIASLPGINAGVVHRLTLATANTFDTLPHAGPVALQLQLFGYSHKQVYKHLFVVTVLVPCIYVAVGLIFTLLAY